MERKKAIALVMVTAFVDGQRVQINPGEELPEGISEHDLKQLERVKAIQYPDATAQAEKDAAKDAEKALGGFNAEKKAVQAAQASTADKVDAKDSKKPTAGKGQATKPATAPV